MLNITRWVKTKIPGRPLLVLALFSSFTLSASELKQNQTGIEIVIGTEASPSAVFAAQELKNALKEVLNAEAAVVTEDRGGIKASFRFLVGPLEKYPLDKKLQNDCFVIDSPEPDTLRLGGRDNDVQPLAPNYRAVTGTLYSVYRFMHDKLGVRMLWPGEGGVVYPKLTSVQLKDYQIQDGPKLPIRSAFYGHGRRYPLASQLAAVRWGRFNGLGLSWIGWFNHSSAQAIGDQYVKTHPEYYALIRGKRVVPNPQERDRWKICDSNPDLPVIFAEWGMKHPDGKDFFPVSPNDGQNWCECAECLKLDAGQKAKFGNLDDPLCTSGRVFTLADRVAQELEKRRSKQLVALYAYGAHTDPPKNLTRLHDQVLVAVAKGISWNLVPEDEKKFDDLMKLWSGKAKNVLLRDYPGISAMAVTPYPHLAARTLKELCGTFENFRGIDNCGDDNRSYALWGPTQYVLARLLWNPDLDTEKLLDEYYEAGWPKSQKFIRDYFDYFEKRTAEVRKHGKNQYPGNLLGGLEVMSEDAIAYGRKLLNQAKKATETDKEELERVEFLRTALEASALDSAYYKALIAVGAMHNVPQPPQKNDRLTTLADAMKIIAARNAFMEKHRDHEGIPSAVTKFNSGNSSTEKDVQLKYEAAKKQPPSEAISLVDGWRFSLDDPGVAANFFKPDFNDSKWEMITTSSAWEKQGFAGYDGWGFYRRKITVPASWTEGRIVLVLGAVDESYRLFCDGELVQEYLYTKADPDGWIRERRIDLTEKLTPGTHLIAVAVHDSGGDGGIWRPAALHLERPNLLVGDPLETLRDARRDGQKIIASGKKFSFDALLRWAKPGTYCVTLRFTPQSNGGVTIRVNTRTQNQWNKVTETWAECTAGKDQILTLPASIASDSIGLHAIISVRMSGMDFQSLEIIPEKQEENK